MKVKILRCSSVPDNLLQPLSASAASPSLSMAAQRSLMGEAGGGRMLDKDEEDNVESPAEKKYKAEKSPLARWEFMAAIGVFLVFCTVLLCIYLTMPESEYEMLKLPRTLADLRMLK